MASVPPEAMKHIVVVGASLAGLHAAQTLRAEGFDGTLTVVGEESHAPYDRPPLSKQVLSAGWTLDQIGLLSTDRSRPLDVEWALGSKARTLDVVARTVTLDDDRHIRFDGLVIATGATPRRLPASSHLKGVHVVRTWEDAHDLRTDLDGGPHRVVVIGSGFVGAEIAAACRQRGLDVTVLEALSAPFGRVLGEQVGAACTRLHRSHGVDVRGNTTVCRLEGRGRVERVVLADGSTISADVVVVGIGVIPQTGWLVDTGLDISDGILCDETCSAAPGIVAAGDVSRWHNPRFGRSMRVEHWDNAVRQGEHAARRLLGATTAYDPVPWFWSDQYDKKIQLAGDPYQHDEVAIVEDDPAEGRLLALYRRGNLLSAVACINRPRRLLAFRRLLTAGATWSEALTTEPE